MEMPNKGQKCVTVPEKVFAKVSQCVKAGKEDSVSGTFVKAVNLYLDLKDKDAIQDTIDWYKKQQQRLQQLKKIKI
jgi:hypothetical protein